jgi:hypothetical protein
MERVFSTNNQLAVYLLLLVLQLLYLFRFPFIEPQEYQIFP